MTKALLLITVALFVVASVAVNATPLDDYVKKDDGHFSYSYSGVTRGGNGWTAYMYNMTSQKWMDSSYSSRPIWWHQMAIVVPHSVNVTLDSAFLYITGRSNKMHEGYPSEHDEGLLVAAMMAIAARSSAAVLWQDPNECMTFKHDPRPGYCRTEDAAIAYTWWAYNHPEKLGTNTSNPEWVLELPMTKAGIRAIDLIQAVVPKHTGGVNISGVYVAGASKRGWTTWLVGAVDRGVRVRAIMPIVLDALHVTAFAHRQFQFYGAWSFALKPYYDMNFTQDLDSAKTKELMQLIDPWYYKERLTMPKLAINAVGDEFQMPDDQRHWAHLMPGEMNIIMVKNAEHSMATGVIELMQSAGAFLQALQYGYKRPSYTWEIDNTTGVITVTTDRTPKRVDVSYAESAVGVSKGRRDFRWAALNTSFCLVKVFGACIRPILWTTTNKHWTQIGHNKYQAKMDTPTDGTWRAFMLELQWDNPTGPDDFYFTSPVSVIPNTLPFADCHGRECRGTLC